MFRIPSIAERVLIYKYCTIGTGTKFTIDTNLGLARTKDRMAGKNRKKEREGARNIPYRNSRAGRMERRKGGTENYFCRIPIHSPRYPPQYRIIQLFQYCEGQCLGAGNAQVCTGGIR
ncbi:unnamed protein product [Tuber aestivum]|uniref:Uncharacterized protein n=1 Tax=Tuber aestivum TaxID=59557 RepID=A0A292Q617_9PEZI|nr:unnamed protein product [Tuber aestivum]